VSLSIAVFCFVLFFEFLPIVFSGFLKSVPANCTGPHPHCLGACSASTSNPAHASTRIANMRYAADVPNRQLPQSHRNSRNNELNDGESVGSPTHNTQCQEFRLFNARMRAPEWTPKATATVGGSDRSIKRVRSAVVHVFGFAHHRAEPAIGHREFLTRAARDAVSTTCTAAGVVRELHLMSAAQSGRT
jgi:hypothetical protein